MKLYEKNASELSDMLRKKECSAVEILSDVKEQIKISEEKIGAYITINDEAEAAAKSVDKALGKGEQISPLAGIPIAVKDNISTKGIKTTCGSKMLENYVPPFNATVVEKILDAGMIITGKTNMDEFAMGSSTETSYFHVTRNPHDTRYVPGGSSGGSAAAVASGEAIVSLGSDTGGSVRQPASMCGVVGFKPTYGSISRYGLVAFASSFDQIGIFGKSVKDAAMVFSEICGADRMDATSTNFMYSGCCLKNNIKGLKIGVPIEFFGDDIDDEVRQSVYNALKLYERNGAKIKKISLPMTEYAIRAYYIISSAEASSNLARYDGVRYGYRADNCKNLIEMYEKSRSEGFGDEVKRRIMLGTFVLSSGYYDEYYKKAKMIQGKITEEISRASEDCDIIAAPSSPTAAFKIGEKMDSPLEMYKSDVCTVTANIAGLPAISIPCGRNKMGLPIGIQLMGKRFDDSTVLDSAYGYEEICWK